MGTVIGFGLLTSIPAILIGYWWAKRIGKSITIEGEEDLSGIEDALDDVDSLPSAMKSFAPIVLPLVLIGAGSIFKILELAGSFAELIYFIGNPLIALLIGVFAAMALMPRFDEEHVGKWIGKAIRQAGPILLITGAGGAFGGVLKATPLTELIRNSVATNDISGIYFVLIAFGVAAALKVSQGSSTAALVITSSLLAPILAAVGIATPTALALIVMAIGAGAMTVSHANDSYFWVVSQFGGIAVGDAYRSFTVVTLFQGCAVLTTTIILYAILV